MGESIPTQPIQLWTHPAPETTQMWLFKERVEKKYDMKLVGYQGLYDWSIENVADFWREVALFTGLHAGRRKGEKDASDAKRRKLDTAENEVNGEKRGPASEELFDEVSEHLFMTHVIYLFYILFSINCIKLPRSCRFPSKFSLLLAIITVLLYVLIRIRDQSSFNLLHTFVT
jgi:hypothetical protein